ncbi:MAG: hypothetical protein HYZ37_06375 [Candidatus Solibacter usitatus]|nr:hypothetical protein [Candidatus Solibacter usitatus]
MNNHEPDLEAYALGEVTPAERLLAEEYLAAHPEAMLEVERLRAVALALQRLPDEEPPRRIAFVSDKVFEPKWYQRLWNSASGLGFASAALLAAAIFTHGVMVRTPPANAQAAQTEISAQVEKEVARRVDAAVAQVRAESDAKSQRMVQVALEQSEKRFTLERQSDRLMVEASFDTLRKQMNRVLQMTSYARGGAE